MLDLIEVFIKSYFTDELQYEIKRSFSLFEKFDYQDYEYKFNFLHDSDLDSADKITLFFRDLNSCIDFIINEHRISLNEDIDLQDKNELLTVLYNLMELEDYSAIISVLESFESDETKLYTIISDNSNLDITKLYTMISNVEFSILDKLKEFSEIRDLQINHIVPEEVKKDIRYFFECFGQNNLGYILVNSGVLLNIPFEEYLPFIEDSILGSSDNETAVNLLSVLIISNNGRNDPITVYREHSLDLLGSLTKTSVIDTLISNNLAKFFEFKQVKDQIAKG